MVETDQRVLVLAENNAEGVPWYHLAFEVYQETPYRFLDPSEFDDPWPEGVPAQIHMMEDDPEVKEGDLDAARAFDAATDGAELFLYPGDKHLFAERGLPDFDEAAAALLRERALVFLDRVG